MSEIYDITLIGAGPVGLFGVFYAGMRHMKTQVVEALPQVGGQLSALYPEKDIFDVAGFPKVQSKKLVADLKVQADAANHDVVYNLDERVTNLQKQEDGSFKLTTTKGEYNTKSVLITAGIGAFEPNRVPNEGARRLENKGVFYNVSEVDWYRGKNVLVVGGGDSAVDYALMLEPVANRVTLIHRRDGFRAHEESLKRLSESKVDVRVFYEMGEVRGEEWVTEAVIFDNRDRAETVLKLDAIVLGTGFKASLGPIKEWGLDLQGNQILTNSKGETNIPGVYAAGDISAYPGKIRLIATGFGEVATAVNNAKAYTDPGSAAFPGHSSEASGKH